MNYKLKKISGDASFREFYRLQKGRGTSIIVQAKKEKFKNLITYIVVNNILKKNKIYAPKLITNHYDNNIIEISDLGNKSFYEFIIKKKDKLNNYKNFKIRASNKLDWSFDGFFANNDGFRDQSGYDQQKIRLQSKFDLNELSLIHI